jgi:hypothetical protein
LSRYKSRTTGQAKGGGLEDDAQSVCSGLQTYCTRNRCHHFPLID